MVFLSSLVSSLPCLDATPSVMVVAVVVQLISKRNEVRFVGVVANGTVLHVGLPHMSHG